MIEAMREFGDSPFNGAMLRRRMNDVRFRVQGGSASIHIAQKISLYRVGSPTNFGKELDERKKKVREPEYKLLAHGTVLQRRVLLS